MSKRIISVAISTLLLVSIIEFTVFSNVKHVVGSEANSVVWWSMFHHDPQHSGYSTSTAPENNSLRWVYETLGAVKSSPAVVDDIVFVGSNDDHLYAINLTRGEPKWRYPTGGDVVSSPAVADNKVFVGSLNGTVHALFLNGDLNWSSTYLGGGIESSPAVAYGMVFVGSSNGRVYALNQLTGGIIWSNTTTSGTPITSSPAVVDGIVYIGSKDNKLYAFNATNGIILWTFDAEDEIWSSPAVVNGTVYVGSRNARVFALNATNGSKIWEFITPGVGAVTSSPAVAYGKVFVGSWDKWVYALPQDDPNDDGAISSDEISWKEQTNGAILSSPAVADDKVFVGSDDDRIYAFNATDGTPIWNYLTGNNVYSSPAIASVAIGSFVFVGSDNHRLYAFGPPNRAPEGNFTSSPEQASFMRTVTFNGTSSYDPDVDDHVESYTWDFGDGTSTTVTDPIEKHVYRMPGIYTVKLTVTDTYGLGDSTPAESNITILEGWPMFHHDLYHKGYSASKAPITNATLWTENRGAFTSSPAVADNIVFIGSNDGYIYAFNATTGIEKWRYPTGVIVESSPAVTDDAVFVGSSDGFLYKLNKATGAEMRRSAKFGAIGSSSPMVVDGKVFIGSQDNNLYALNETTLEKVWSFDTDGDVYSSPAFNDGKVFIGSDNNTICALHLENGSLIWSFPTHDWVRSSPAVADGVIFVGADDGFIYALREVDGMPIWAYNVSHHDNFIHKVRSSPAIAGGMVFVGADDGYLYALNETDGKLVWRYETGGAIYSSPAIAEAEGRLVVVFGSEDGKIYELSENGAVYWSFQTSGQVRSSPAFLDGRVFIGSSNGNLTAFRDPQGYTVNDIATVRIEPHKTVVGPVVGQATTQVVNISVLVENQGTFNETFEVALFINTTNIENKTVLQLAPAASAIVVFEWNATTFSKGNYTVSATAETVPGETDAADNTHTYSWMAVTIQGDINADRKVDMRDLGAQGRAFGSTPGSPLWNPNADINNDRKIDMRDISYVARKFGESW